MLSEKYYQEITLTIDTVDADLIDLLSACFYRFSCTGVSIKYAHGYLENHPNLFGEIPEELPKEILEHPTQIIGYFEEKVTLNDLADAIREVTDLPFDLSEEKIKDENWQESWMENYKPTSLTRYLTVVPIWYEYETRPLEQVIYLDPGLAFGTGTHPTTMLGAQALEIVMRGGEVVLDVGTGSGVLSFAAVCLGASEVLGYDLDPQAVSYAKGNLEYQKEKTDYEVYKNDLCNFYENDLLKGVDKEADIIVANILPHILVNLFPYANKLLKDSGYLILGGILKEKGSEIEEAYTKAGYTCYQKTLQGEWLCYILTKAES